MAQQFEIHLTANDWVTANRFVTVSVPDGVSPESVLEEIRDYDDTFGLQSNSDFFKHQTLGLKVVRRLDGDDVWAGDALTEVQDIKSISTAIANS